MSTIQHILIVADDWMTRSAWGDYLAEKGYRISLSFGIESGRHP